MVINIGRGKHVVDSRPDRGARFRAVLLCRARRAASRAAAAGKPALAASEGHRDAACRAPADRAPARGRDRGEHQQPRGRRRAVAGDRQDGRGISGSDRRGQQSSLLLQGRNVGHRDIDILHPAVAQNAQPHRVADPDLLQDRGQLGDVVNRRSVRGEDHVPNRASGAGRRDEPGFRRRASRAARGR